MSLLICQIRVKYKYKLKYKLSEHVFKYRKDK